MTRLLPGGVALGILALLVGGALGALLWTAPAIDLGTLWTDTYLRHVIGFTIWQASLSTALSIAFAIPVARALARRQAFPGRGAILRLFGLPLVIPTIVAVFGIVAIYGQVGVLNRLAGFLGLPTRQYLYGLPGILIAHVFFNMPLAVRLMLPVWYAVPGELWRLSAQLGMRSGHIFRLIEWPLLLQVLPGAAGLVFMLCFTSFAVVLTLGGGPASTTVEVAIYQALRFEFDLGRAVLLALVQLLLCGTLIALGQRLARPMTLAPTPQRPQERPDLAPLGGRIADFMAIAAGTLFVLLPILAVLHAGVTGPISGVLGDSRLWAAALRSLTVALAAGVLSLTFGWAMLLTSRELRLRRYRPRAADAIEVSGSAVLVVTPLVLGTGFFVLLSPFADVFALALLLVVIVNAIMGLPFVVRVLGPPVMRVAEQHDRLCASLGISGWNRFRLVEWPMVRRSAGLALALGAALATGDLGAIALFGTQDTTTLPLLMYQRMASYQMRQAAVTALVLVGLCLLIFIIIERGVGGRGRT